jgi:translation initiation factor 2 alpha subunit (eIF-2alpha)
MEQKQIQEGDLILCTVTNIENTSVSVSLPDGKTGTIITAEIAPGRIRNIRDYVVPNKKIVCKVLRLSQNHIDLSLRRVTSKEKNEVMEIFKQEQTAKSILNSILKEKSAEVQEKILKNFQNLHEFFNSARENEKVLADYFQKNVLEQIKKVLQKKKKEIEVKKLVKFKCLSSDGINRIKEILKAEDGIEITYLAAGNFQISIKDSDYKKANQKMNNFIQKIEQKAKKDCSDFSVEDK